MLPERMSAPESLLTALASRYTFGNEIGRGGMATVYSAHDLRHERPVAIKLLSEDASAARGTERFLQEIRVAARLNHPHILPLFDSGQVEGRLYFVMPLVRGESLRQRLRRDGKLPLDDTLRIAREIGDALTYAHEAGVIHRDVKPENILLAHGHALLSDFGVARAPGATTRTEALTQTGMIVGTPEYMSPEQLLGDDLGPASDIYALGCVVYEMLAGSAPQAGARLQAIMAERLSKKAPSVRELRSDVTISMDQSLSRALAANPSDRFTNAREFAAALTQRGTTEHSADAARSLIVRPFDPVGEDSELESFCDGLTEEVIGGLSKLRSLRVISRTSAMRLKRTTQDVRSIGNDYGVRYVVTGSVRRAASRVRVAAEIVDALLDAPVWAGKFDGSMDDPFGVQESVASGVVEALHVSLTPDEQRRVFQRPIADPRAYERYRMAIRDIVTFSPEGLQRAEALLNEGLAMVGDNAQLFAGLGSLHWQYVNGGVDVSEERLAKALHWLERALALDPENADAHLAMAWIHGSRGRMRAAVQHLNRVIAADPNHSLGLAFFAVVDWIAGRNDHMREVVRRQQAIDPYELWGVIVAGVASALDGDIAARDRCFRRATEISPTPFVLFMHGHLLAQDQESAAARDIWGKFEGAAADDLGVVFCQAGAAALDGRADTVRSLLSRDDVRQLLDLDAQWGWFAASTYALAGLRDEGIAALDVAVRQGLSNVLLIESRDATLAPLRDHPRFASVLRRARETLAELERATGAG
jgi:serine/threonine protein kinase/tetratricopeptide (TPR) repeat protein